ncbi:MAG TPA: TylF/MycF/NovP-related O-methyltransferase [Solirubrobacteraceae bacterium]|jgi:hypothetical protein|nr:TylF/MycF/NovP-related O-methyltransferase [Solirubrobacteraceae bacterium]
MNRVRWLLHWSLVRLAGVFNRNPWTSYKLKLVPRADYDHDALTTSHNHSFLDDPDFRSAYERAVQAAGWDYGIYWRVHVLLWAARTALKVPGAFVECGTGRGFMGSAVCRHLAWSDRPFYLFDTFQPEMVTPDSSRRGHAHSPVYARGAQEVRRNFRDWPGVQLVVGTIPESLGDVNIEHVAFLHIDLNHPAPEAAALRHFWPKLSPGAMVVFDDYAYTGFEASYRSANQVAEELGFSIVSLPTGQGLAIK